MPSVSTGPSIRSGSTRWRKRNGVGSRPMSSCDGMDASLHSGSSSSREALTSRRARWRAMAAPKLGIR